MERIEMFTLRVAREKAGFTQKEAADVLKISPDTLRNYETGKSQPDVQMIKKIEALYHVPFSQLIFLGTDYGKTVITEE